MGDIMSTLGTIGTDVMQGFQGAGQALGDITGFSGGGGPLSPGSLNSIAQSFGSAPNALGSAIDTAASVAPAATSAASAMAAPGVLSSIDPQAVMSGVGGGASSIDPQFAFPAGAGAAALGDPTAGVSNFNIPGMAPSAMSAMDPNSVLARATALPDVANIPGVTVDAANTVSSPYALPGGTLATGAAPASGFLQGLLRDPKMLAALIPAAATMLGASQKPPGLKDIQNLEAQQAGLAKNQGELALGEQSGLLPAGAQSAYQRLLDANLANIRANYAERGLTGSSAEMQDLAAARMDVQNQVYQAAQNMAKDSWTNYGNATKYQSDLLDTIMNTEITQQNDFRQALADMAAAFTK